MKCMIRIKIILLYWDVNVKMTGGKANERLGICMDKMDGQLQVDMTALADHGLFLELNGTS